MTAQAPAILCRQYRNTLLEVVMRGHVVIVDSEGRVTHWAGDVSYHSSLRSSFKPFQAAALDDLGTFDAFGLGPESVAIAAGSHMGEARHVEEVRRILVACGLSEGNLKCGIHRPESVSAADSLVRGGIPFAPIHNNCSGKHAAMLAACVQQRWPVDSYMDPEHPVQREVAKYFSRFSGIPQANLNSGVDGCGVPTYGLPLLDFARALSRAATSDPAMVRVLSAMSGNPFMVGGSESFDTAFMQATDGEWVAKTGAEGIFCAVRTQRPMTVVIKFESGQLTYLPMVTARVFRLAKLLTDHEMHQVDQIATSTVYNWSGTAVGLVRCVFELE